jgi:hypothetical protein
MDLTILARDLSVAKHCACVECSAVQYKVDAPASRCMVGIILAAHTAIMPTISDGGDNRSESRPTSVRGGASQLGAKYGGAKW